MSTLRNQSMLVNLTIHKWSARKHDKSVSAEVEKSHGAKDAGRYNKMLIDKSYLAPLDTLESEIRRFHYAHTLPWMDGGLRLLPSKLFMDYQKGMSGFKQRWATAVSDFQHDYADAVNQARTRLKTMFNAKDYPLGSELYSLFDIELEILPVPDAQDFRVDVAEETQNEIRAQITRSIEERQAKAIKDCYARMREVVERIAQTCSKEKARIYDSMIDNTIELVRVLDGLNITNDPAITELQQNIQALVVPAETLRNSPAARKAAAQSADEILEKMACFQ